MTIDITNTQHLSIHSIYRIIYSYANNIHASTSELYLYIQQTLGALHILKQIFQLVRNYGSRSGHTHVISQNPSLKCNESQGLGVAQIDL